MKSLYLMLILLSPTVLAHTTHGVVKNVVDRYEMVRVADPECRYITRNKSGSNVGTFLGAIVGGVVGSHFGSGSGNTVSTAAGAAVGAVSGQSIANSQNNIETVCSTRYETRHIRTGYLVTIEHNKTQFDVFLNYHPGIGTRIPVTTIIK